MELVVFHKVGQINTKSYSPFHSSILKSPAGCIVRGISQWPSSFPVPTPLPSLTSFGSSILSLRSNYSFLMLSCLIRWWLLDFWWCLFCKTLLFKIFFFPFFYLLLLNPFNLVPIFSTHFIWLLITFDFSSRNTQLF